MIAMVSLANNDSPIISLNMVVSSCSAISSLTCASGRSLRARVLQADTARSPNSSSEPVTRSVFPKAESFTSPSLPDGSDTVRRSSASGGELPPRGAHPDGSLTRGERERPVLIRAPYLHPEFCGKPEHSGTRVSVGVIDA